MIRRTRLFARMDKARPGVIPAILLIAALSISAAVFHTKNPIARGAEGYAASIATVSAATYVTLRTLNAILSTAQEVEVGASVGVSGSLQPGKILEPVDDTIERIASAVFTLMLVSGVLAIAMGPIGAIGGGMIALACLLRLVAPHERVLSAARKLGVYGAFLALGLPLCLIASNLLAVPLTGSALVQHQSVVDAIVADVPNSASDSIEISVDDERWFDGLRDTFSAGTDYLVKGQRFLAQANSIMTNADTLIKSYLSILAVLIFRIFLLPILLVVAVWQVARSFARS